MQSPVRPSIVVACSAVAAALAALVLFAAPALVDAQGNQAARFTIETSPANDDLSTVTVALDPGTSRIAALSAELSFDSDVVSAESCQLSIPGACNVVDGRIKFAGLSVNGFGEVDDFLTVTFRSSGDATVAVPLELAVETVSDDLGMALDDIELVGADLHMVEALGSITGDVVDQASGAGLYDIDVCATSEVAEATCVRTSGLGSFVIDGLASGTHTLVISDPAGLYTPVTEIVDVESPAITTGITAAMVPAVVEAIIEDAPAPIEEPRSANRAALPGDPSTVTGMVTDGTTGTAIFGLQVCATMPVIGTQSCSYTTTTGTYRIEGLATGNYNVTVSDPGQRYASTDTDRFVGVTTSVGAAGIDITVERN